MGGHKIFVAVFSFAYVLFLSANHSSGLSTVNPWFCRLPCTFFQCGVTDASNCKAGEQYVKSRRWCDCCGANCCGACVKTVGIGDNCTSGFYSSEGHYVVCPSGSQCNHDTSKCQRSNSTTPILP